MAQLFFKYGTMNSSKSANLLMTAHNYESQGKNVIIMTSALDTRAGNAKVESRVGLTADAMSIMPQDNVYELYADYMEMSGYDPRDIACVLIDEAQFLTQEQVEQIAYGIVDGEEIPVICYGLKTDFQGHLFNGSKALFELADKLEEIKTVCQFCNKKATMNLRTVNGMPVYDGEQVQIGDQEYLSVCRHHWDTAPIFLSQPEESVHA